jgi:molybdenum cofactor biosynthesis protein B
VAEAEPGQPIADAWRVPLGTRAFVLTVSDGVAHGSRQDEAGAALASRLEHLGFTPERGATADEADLISVAIRSALDQHVLVLTTGGTGLTPRDVTPQATMALLDYEIPGLAEAMRAAGRARTPMADLSRGVVGVARGRLVVNVPGSPRAALESLAALEPTLRHALETLAGPFNHDVAATARPDLPDPDLDAATDGIPGTQLGTLSSAAPFGAATAPTAEPNLLEHPAPAPGDASDPWRDLPPARDDEFGEGSA